MPVPTLHFGTRHASMVMQSASALHCTHLSLLQRGVIPLHGIAIGPLPSAPHTISVSPSQTLVLGLQSLQRLSAELHSSWLLHCVPISKPLRSGLHFLRKPMSHVYASAP